MRAPILSLTIVFLSILLAGCPAPPATNNANSNARPANSANTANTNTSADVSADVKKMMSELAAALAKNDADAASKFYADDYHLVTPDGADQSRAERIADMRSGTTKFDSFSYEDVNVRTYGDTAVAIATVKAKGIVQGKPRSTDMRATLVFHKMADGWKVVSGQATPITAAAAPAANSNANTAANKAPASNTANKAGNTY